MCSKDPSRQFADRIVFRPTKRQQAKIYISEKPIVGCAYLIATDNMTGREFVKGDDPDHNAVVVLRDGYMDRKGVWQPPKIVARMPLFNMWNADILAEYVWQLHIFSAAA